MKWSRWGCGLCLALLKFSFCILCLVSSITYRVNSIFQRLTGSAALGMWPVTSLMDHCPAGCFQVSGKVSIFFCKSADCFGTCFSSNWSNWKYTLGTLSERARGCYFGGKVICYVNTTATAKLLGLGDSELWCWTCSLWLVMKTQENKTQNSFLKLEIHIVILISNK